jgi:hypothetical protein
VMTGRGVDQVLPYPGVTAPTGTEAPAAPWPRRRIGAGFGIRASPSPLGVGWLPGGISPVRRPSSVVLGQQPVEPDRFNPARCPAASFVAVPLPVGPVAHAARRLTTRQPGRPVMRSRPAKREGVRRVAGNESQGGGMEIKQAAIVVVPHQTIPLRP